MLTDRLRPEPVLPYDRFLFLGGFPRRLQVQGSRSLVWMWVVDVGVLGQLANMLVFLSAVSHCLNTPKRVSVDV